MNILSLLSLFTKNSLKIRSVVLDGNWYYIPGNSTNLIDAFNSEISSPQYISVVKFSLPIILKEPTFKIIQKWPLKELKLINVTDDEIKYITKLENLDTLYIYSLRISKDSFNFILQQ